MLRKSWLTSAALAVLAIASVTALPATSLAAGPAVATPVVDWSGFYVGGTVGERWTSSNLKINAIDETYSNNTLVQHNIPQCATNTFPCITGRR